LPFQFKGLPWRNSEFSIILRIFFRKRKKCSHRASRIAQSPAGESLTPLSSNKLKTKSSTPDVLQTSLSIYQFKSALSRKSAPLAFTSFRRPWMLEKGQVMEKNLRRQSTVTPDEGPLLETSKFSLYFSCRWLHLYQRRFIIYITFVYIHPLH
jgi:hypothetical protein